MAMTKTEATYVNVLLNWMTGTPGNRGVPDNDDARYAAALLARSARRALGAGVGPGTVEEFFDDQNPRVLPGLRRALAPEVADLLAGWWQLEETGEGDGGPIGGAELIEFVGQWFTETCGANLTHPLQRAANANPWVDPGGRGEWDEVRDLRPFARAHGTDDHVPVVCEDCGGPVRDLPVAPLDHPVCTTCAARQAEEARA